MTLILEATCINVFCCTAKGLRHSTLRFRPGTGSRRPRPGWRPGSVLQHGGAVPELLVVEAHDVLGVLGAQRSRCPMQGAACDEVQRHAVLFHNLGPHDALGGAQTTSCNSPPTSVSLLTVLTGICCSVSIVNLSLTCSEVQAVPALWVLRGTVVQKAEKTGEGGRNASVSRPPESLDSARVLDMRPHQSSALRTRKESRRP